jgi:ADP-heptose:LPS heptosyltransferase
VSRWSGARVRIAPDDAREGASLAATHRVPMRGTGSGRARTTALLAPLGISTRDEPTVRWAPHGSPAVDRFLDALPPGPRVVLQPGAAWATKRWPVERYAHVADALTRQGNVVIVAWGPGERALAERVVASSSAAHLAPPTDLPALAALLEGAALVVGGDTGPVHLAGALGAPTLALHGPTDPARHGAWGPRVHAMRAGLPCSPCRHETGCPHDVRCMHELGTDAVVAEARALLEG